MNPINQFIEEMNRPVWDELNARPLTPPPAWVRTHHVVQPLIASERIGKTRRLRSEPPCAVCGNKSAWRCECELGEEA
jgi:hypothetical protein